MPQIPGSGTLEQVLLMLQAIGQSAAFAAEAAAVNTVAAASLVYSITDIAGVRTPIELKEAQFSDPSWLAGSFANVLISDRLNVPPPYPILVLVGASGRLQGGTSGSFDEREVAGWRHRVDAVVVADSSENQSALRQALLLLDAFDRLIGRNQSLGGLVQLITPETPPIPATGRLDDENTIAGAMIRYGVDVLRFRG